MKIRISIFGTFTFFNKRPIHGLIFLFKWIGNTEIDGTFVTDQEKLDDIFFLKQVNQVFVFINWLRALMNGTFCTVLPPKDQYLNFKALDHWVIHGSTRKLWINFFKQKSVNPNYIKIREPKNNCFSQKKCSESGSTIFVHGLFFTNLKIIYLKYRRIFLWNIYQKCILKCAIPESEN